MTEVSLNTSQTVSLDITNATAQAGSVHAVFVAPDKTITILYPAKTTANVPTGTERWEVFLNIAHLQKTGEAKVVWTFKIGDDDVSKTDYLDIVIPLAEVSYIREQLDVPFNITPEQIAAAERRVRYQIQTITHQKFYTWQGSSLAVSVAPGELSTRTRVISLTRLDWIGLPSAYYNVTIDPGHYKIYMGLAGNENENVQSSIPIFNPYTSRNWKNGQKVPIVGTFGWERVPPEVTEAALVLIEEALCPESIYRERYLQSMTAADFRIQFNNEAFRSTGNVVADMLLDKFRRSYMAVI